MRLMILLFEISLVYVVITQVLVPALMGGVVFPWFRTKRHRELLQEIEAAKEARIDAALEEQLERLKKKEKEDGV